MGEPSQDSAAQSARRPSLLASIGAVEHPGELHTEERAAAEPGQFMNDGERLVAFSPVGSDPPPPADAGPLPVRLSSDPFAEFEAALAATYPPPAAPVTRRPRGIRLGRRDLRWVVLGATLALLAATLVVVFWSGPACCGDARAPQARPT
ncbi:hypothetical protein, partial [Luedemannella flava]|uniref:hypothetical protein n=1 Tax=Luedemannella flava TaxID=349316 RepID=UPI0031D39725